MSIPAIRCKKHGLCKANVIYECKVCASENEEAAKTANNNRSVEICDNSVCEYCTHQGFECDTCDRNFPSRFEGRKLHAIR